MDDSKSDLWMMVNSIFWTLLQKLEIFDSSFLLKFVLFFLFQFQQLDSWLATCNLTITNVTQYTCTRTNTCTGSSNTPSWIKEEGIYEMKTQKKIGSRKKILR
jgi:hypothetical protein